MQAVLTAHTPQSHFPASPIPIPQCSQLPHEQTDRTPAANRPKVGNLPWSYQSEATTALAATSIAAHLRTRTMLRPHQLVPGYPCVPTVL